MVNTDVRGRSYAPIGQTPVAYAVGGTRQKLSMIATVTNQGKARWMIIDDAFNSDRLIEFLGALVKDAGKKKVFLILDNLRVHHSKPVKKWVAEHAEQIELFYLPSYSPELNPEERLNADLKQAMGSKVPARTQAKFRSAATQHMTELEQSPERVKVRIPPYFHQPFSFKPCQSVRFNALQPFSFKVGEAFRLKSSQSHKNNPPRRRVDDR